MPFDSGSRDGSDPFGKVPRDNFDAQSYQIVAIHWLSSGLRASRSHQWGTRAADDWAPFDQPHGAMTRVMAHIRMLHPLTSLAVALVTMAIAMPAGGAAISFHVLRVGLVMLLIQFSIGVHNDLLDQRYDSQAKPWKPIPAGLVKQRTAFVVFIALLVGALLLSLRFGLFPFAIMLFGLACGLGYNIGLKRTALSWLPHSLAAPTILVWSRAINESASPILLWAYPLGMLLGPALNVANQLPGAEAARASGEFSLLHRLGPVKGRRIAGGLFLLTATLMPLVVFGNQGVIQTAVVGSSVAVAFTGIFMVLAERDHRIALWPTALIIGAVLGITFHLSV